MLRTREFAHALQLDLPAFNVDISSRSLSNPSTVSISHCPKIAILPRFPSSSIPPSPRHPLDRQKTPRRPKKENRQEFCRACGSCFNAQTSDLRAWLSGRLCIIIKADRHDGVRMQMYRMCMVIHGTMALNLVLRNACTR